MGCPRIQTLEMARIKTQGLLIPSTVYPLRFLFIYQILIKYINIKKLIRKRISFKITWLSHYISESSVQEEEPPQNGFDYNT